MKLLKYNINNLTHDEYQKWYNLSNQTKKDRVNKARIKADKIRSVCADMLVKKAIAELTNIPAEKIILDEKENGKPYPVNIDLHFNISHCEDYVVCVVDTKPVGIDIEKIRPINLKIAKRFFNDEEQKYIFGHSDSQEDFEKCSDNQILKRFFEIWTAKEAYLKYTGEGICADLKAISVPRKNVSTKIHDGYIITVYKEK